MKYIKEMKLFEFVVDQPELKKIVDSGITPLYHAIELNRAKVALDENKLGGYSKQRIWKGGKKYKDDQPEYEDSYYMRGISTSRDIEYCSKWNDIIFVFDSAKLKNKYKIVPYNWGSTIGGGYEQGHRVKREREEFVVTGYSDPNKEINDDEEFDGFSDSYKKNQKAFTMLETPKGYIEPLSKFLLGFFISDRFIKYKNEEELKYFQSHKNYLGIYTDNDTKKNKNVPFKDRLKNIFTKKFESFNDDPLQYGDYVICKENLTDHFPEDPIMFDFSSTTPGIYRGLDRNDNNYHLVEYDNIPDTLENYFEGKMRRMRRFEIVLWAKTPEELELKISTKKYNM